MNFSFNFKPRGVTHSPQPPRINPTVVSDNNKLSALKTFWSNTINKPSMTVNKQQAADFAAEKEAAEFEAAKAAAEAAWVLKEATAAAKAAVEAAAVEEARVLQEAAKVKAEQEAVVTE